MSISNELQIGKAGEYLVCADLIMKGFIAYPSEQGLPYDVVLDNRSGKLLKVQVKTTACVKDIPQRYHSYPGYVFSIKRHGKNNVDKYTENDVDIFALVCLDAKRIGYLKNEDFKICMTFRSDENKGEYYNEQCDKRFKEVIRLHSEGVAVKKISEITGFALAVVYKMINPNYVRQQRSGRYFSEIERDKQWFLQ